MSSKDRKYTEAWDRVAKKMVTPEQISRAEAHDRNRYFSERFEENENKGKVLTLHKESKPFINKNGKEVIRKTHFSAIAENTIEYREQTAKKQAHQESLVHKLCKTVINEIEFIHIPEVKHNILGVDIAIIQNQYLKVLKVKSTEKRDEDTNRIPDAVIEVEILGVKQEIYLEFFYKHQVDETKRKQYQLALKNCLEIDLSDLQDNLEESEKSLKSKIKQRISENAYWISNRLKQIILMTLSTNQSRYVLELSLANVFRKTFYHKDNSLEKRLFLYKDGLDNYYIDDRHPCKYHSEYDKYTDIGQCKNCKNCAALLNYDSDNVYDVRVYCKREPLGLNIAQIIQLIIEEAIMKL